MNALPEWLATEHSVKRFFQLLGFVVQNVSISGRQIDLVATRPDPMIGEQATYVVEITTEKVGAVKGSADSQKLLLARTEYPSAKLMLVSTSGFTDDQAATLKKLGIITRRLHELEESVLPLVRYALAAQTELQSNNTPDIGYHPNYYVQPEIKVERDHNPVMTGGEWIDEVISRPKAGIFAVLGSLGSGKTSLLRNALDLGLSRFLDNPDEYPLPLYVPLGRYKQHAGDIDQMLMSELQRAGVDVYPVALMKFFVQKRRIILLLDGLDEVHPIQNADDILQTVSNIVQSIGRDASAVVSCRKQFFESSTEELAYFGSYTAEKLKDLNSGIQRVLRGDPSSSIARVMPFDKARITEYLQIRCSLQPNQVDDLLSQYYGFTDMASTPVLLAMIATTVSEGILPAHGVQHFPHVALYEAYTTRWIERDAGRARLSASQRTHFSEHLADKMMWRGLDSATWTELSSALRSNPEWANNPIPNDEAELDIRNSGFLVREIDDEWRFVHRSIMEYFAARAEYACLASGDRPRHIPTDGYRLFLTELIASNWHRTKHPVFPVGSWQAGRGRDVRVNQWSLLAAASKKVPRDGYVNLAGVGNLDVNIDTDWENVSFDRLVLTISEGHTSFGDCEFNDTRIHIKDAETCQVEFKNCAFVNTTIVFNVLPDRASPFNAEDPQAIDVPIGVYNLAKCLDAGAKVIVGDVEWKLGEENLETFLECGRRLKGKTYVHNFNRGAHAASLAKILPALKKAGLVKEDASRQGHQLDWSPAGRALMTGLRADPVATQKQVAALF